VVSPPYNRPGQKALRSHHDLSEYSVNRSDGDVAHVREHERVDVEGVAYVGVPQKFLHELGVNKGRNARRL
jgi:hypothetical protein